MEKQLMDEITKDTVGEIQRSNHLFAEKVETLLQEVQLIKEDHQSLKDDVVHLQEDQLAANETITDLENNSTN
ncbi:hypothetical protein quinque_009404 [Culex quinquefasciatus]